jgi:hypothetical protein
MDLPAHDWRIVVESYLSVGDSVVVRVSQTSPYNQGYSGSYVGASNATVILAVDESEHLLTEYPYSATGQRPYLYPTLYGLPKSVLSIPSDAALSLRVQYKGKEVRAACNVLPRTRIESFRIIESPTDSFLLDLEIFAAFPPGASYYLVEGKSETLFNGTPALLPFFYDVVRVAGDGSRKTIVLSNPRREVVWRVPGIAKRVLFLRRTDKSFYDFDIALKAQSSEVGGKKKILGTDPVMIPTNILGGVGIFTVANTDSLSLLQ